MTGAVAFDLDGTLFDTPRAIVEGFAVTLAELGLGECAAERIRATIGQPLEEAFARLLDEPADSALVGRAVRHYQRLYRERIVPDAVNLLFPGVTGGLDLLAARGYPLAIATNKHTASAEALLDSAGLRDRFALVVGADAVRQPKPYPEAALLISRRLRARPDQMVVVGDTTHDLLMAKNAGMRSVAVSYGVQDTERLATAGPTWLVDSFPAAVDRILQALPDGTKRPDRDSNAGPTA